MKKKWLTQIGISIFFMKSMFTKYLENVSHHVHMWSNDCNLHEVSDKSRPKMSGGVNIEFNPTKPVFILSRLWGVHLFVIKQHPYVMHEKKNNFYGIVYAALSTNKFFNQRRNSCSYRKNNQFSKWKIFLYLPEKTFHCLCD